MDHIRVWLKAERIAGEQASCNQVQRMLKSEIEEVMTPQKLRFLRARVLCPKACICHSRESILYYYIFQGTCILETGWNSLEAE